MEKALEKLGISKGDSVMFSFKGAPGVGLTATFQGLISDMILLDIQMERGLIHNAVSIDSLCSIGKPSEISTGLKLQ